CARSRAVLQPPNTQPSVVPQFGSQRSVAAPSDTRIADDIDAEHPEGLLVPAADDDRVDRYRPDEGVIDERHLTSIIVDVEHRPNRPKLPAAERERAREI